MVSGHFRIGLTWSGSDECLILPQNWINGVVIRMNMMRFYNDETKIKKISEHFFDPVAW